MPPVHKTLVNHYREIHLVGKLADVMKSPLKSKTMSKHKTTDETKAVLKPTIRVVPVPGKGVEEATSLEPKPCGDSIMENHDLEVEPGEILSASSSTKDEDKETHYRSHNQVMSHIKNFHEWSINHNCYRCGKVVKSSTELRIHNSTAHGLKDSCHLCQSKFRNESLLQLHLQKYHRLPTIINIARRFKISCAYCQQSCSSEQEKIAHEKREHQCNHE